MLSAPSTHRVRVPVGTLALLLALITWGIEYKASLCSEKGFQASVGAPPAKLLTDAERSLEEHGATARSAAISLLQFAGPHWIAAASHDSAAHSSGYLLVASQAVDSPRQYLRTKNFPRPPPLS